MKRSELRSLVRSEIIDAVDGLVDPSDIKFINQDDLSGEVPTIAYDDSYRPIVYNGVGNAPDETIRDVNDYVQQEVWYTYLEGEFTITTRASPQGHQMVYDRIFDNFQKYYHSGWEEPHEHIIRIEVEDDSTNANTAEYGVTFGDSISVRIVFYYRHVKDVDPITDIQTEFDITISDTV